MCLRLKLFAKKQIATEDIVVYKHLNKVSDANEVSSSFYYGASRTKFSTPFRNEVVELGKTYESKLKIGFEFPLKKAGSRSPPSY